MVTRSVTKAGMVVRNEEAVIARKHSKTLLTLDITHAKLDIPWSSPNVTETARPAILTELPCYGVETRIRI